MKIAMDIIDTFQEYIFKTTSSTKHAVKGPNNAVQKGFEDRSNDSHGSKCCCGADSATRMRDCSTSASDLISYVWHTEGEGMAVGHPMTSSINVDDEDENDGFPTCTSGLLKQCTHRLRNEKSRSNKMKAQSIIMCDASTSTFDLSAFVWGLGCNMHIADLASDGTVDDRSTASPDDFSTDIGGIYNARRSLGGGRKRHTDAGAPGCGSGDFAAPPCKKKKRIRSNEEEVFIARTIQLR